MATDLADLPQFGDTSFLEPLLLAADGSDAQFLDVDEKLFMSYLLALDDTAAEPGTGNGATSSGTSDQMHMPLQTTAPAVPCGDLPCAATSATPSRSSPSDDNTATHSDAGAMPQKRKRWKNRTEQQEAVHKLAQLRYREKKKAKVDNLQQSAQQLKDQTAELAQLQATNTTLRDSNSFLEQQVADAEAQLENLRTTPQNGNRAAAAPNGAAASSSGRHDIPANRYTTLMEDDGTFRADYAGEASYDAMKQRLQKEFRAKADALKEMQRRLGQGPDAVYSAEVEAAAAPDQVAEVRRGVAETMQTCFMLARLEGVDMHELVTTADMQENIGPREGEEAALFRDAAAAVGLAPEQRAALLQARERWLLEWERLIADRQAINLQLIGVLLPRVVSQQAGDTAALQAQPGDDEATVALVRRLDANLNEEMRTWCRQDRQFMGMLTPLQGAKYMTMTYPFHCDPLAFTDALHEQEAAPA